MREVIPISGKDSLATAFVQTAREPDLPYEFMFNDVGAELPETYAWLDTVERKTGWHIHRIGRDLKESIAAYNGFLPSSRARYCTRETKIEPMHKWIGRDPATIYYGLRADENRIGYVPVGGKQITPVYPLRELGIDLRGVYSILDAKDLMPPNFFWTRLYEAVGVSMAGWNDWESKITRTEKDVLFAGRSRGNCSFCFFQRLYEWVWLNETHPSLFQEAQAFENVGSEYTWRQDYSLPEIAARADVVFEKRVKDVCKTIRNRFQTSIFTVESEEIAATSCGLLCGK